ncbi:MAG: hypothetical protein EXS55_03705 [Candidatus Magasanikbacteria bacterium]|nr:hypothetical protein [Candidatus Magasanikbacteria bacterium]
MRLFPPITLARLITSFLFTAVIAGTWDAWWHGAVGRESLFEPPHLLLYASAISAVLMGVYGWYTTIEKVWKRVALFLLLIPASAPFDELWHRIFGVEDLSSPLIVWSPPHLAIIFALIFSFIVLIPLLRQDEDALARRLFSSLAFAGILNLLFFVVAPLQPTGPWELLGFWGAGVLAAILVGVFLVYERLFSGIGSSFALAATYLLVTAITFGEMIKPGIKIIPHDHPPSYVIIFAFVIAALIFDLTARLPRAVRGALAAGVWALILYGLSTYYFKLEFQYSTIQTVQAVGASLVGGILTGFLVDKIFAPTKLYAP